MLALYAEIQVAGLAEPVVTFRCRLEQPLAHTGQPSSEVHYRPIRLTLVGLAAMAGFFTEWAADSHLRRSGWLVIYAGEQVRWRLAFYDAHCTLYRTSFRPGRPEREAAYELELALSAAWWEWNGTDVEHYSALWWEKDPHVRKRALTPPPPLLPAPSLRNLPAEATPSVVQAVEPSKELRAQPSEIEKSRRRELIIGTPAAGDVRPAQVVRIITKGESIAGIVSEAKYLTFSEGVEHAVIKRTDGVTYLVSGGSKGIILPADTKVLFGHTHPPVPRGAINTPSVADREALEILGQSKQYVYHDGQRTTLYQNGAEITVSDY